MTALPPKNPTKKKKDATVNDETDWENHWLLRVPTSYADRVRAFCEIASPKEKLQIKFDEDQRHGTLSVGQNTLHFTIHDLPCIIEVMKTIDKVNLYKVNDISQMILCTEEPPQMPPASTPPSCQPSTSADAKAVEDAEAAAAEAQLAKQKREKFYQYPHGIVPPLKNVRKRRFRKTKKKKYMDAPEVEKEVKRLLRDDLASVKCWYEIVTVEEGSKKQEAQQKTDDDKQPAELLAADDEEQNIFEAAQQDLLDVAQQELLDEEASPTPPQPQQQQQEAAPQKDLYDVFGEISSSSSEDEDDMDDV